MAVFCYGLEPPWLTWSITGPDGTMRRGPTVVTGVDEPMMVHDMALTSRFLVLVLAPAFLDLPAAMSGGPFHRLAPRARHTGGARSTGRRAGALGRGRGLLAVAHRQRVRLARPAR
jgi:carotenoid cleavage dioxygenase-like enzyme